MSEKLCRLISELRQSDEDSKVLAVTLSRFVSNRASKDNIDVTIADIDALLTLLPSNADGSVRAMHRVAKQLVAACGDPSAAVTPSTGALTVPPNVAASTPSAAAAVRGNEQLARQGVDVAQLGVGNDDIVHTNNDAQNQRRPPPPHPIDNLCRDHDMSDVDLRTGRCGVCQLPTAHHVSQRLALPPKICGNCNASCDGRTTRVSCSACGKLFAEYQATRIETSTFDRIEQYLTTINKAFANSRRPHMHAKFPVANIMPLLFELKKKCIWGVSCSPLPLEFHGKNLLRAVEWLQANDGKRSVFLRFLKPIVSRNFNAIKADAQYCPEWAGSAPLRASNCRAWQMSKRANARAPINYAHDLYATAIVEALLSTSQTAKKQARKGDRDRWARLDDVLQKVLLRRANYFKTDMSAQAVRTAGSNVDLLVAMAAAGALRPGDGPARANQTSVAEMGNFARAIANPQGIVVAGQSEQTLENRARTHLPSWPLCAAAIAAQAAVPAAAAAAAQPKVNKQQKQKKRAGERRQRDDESDDSRSGGDDDGDDSTFIDDGDTSSRSSSEECDDDENNEQEVLLQEKTKRYFNNKHNDDDYYNSANDEIIGFGGASIRSNDQVASQVVVAASQVGSTKRVDQKLITQFFGKKKVIPGSGY
jgi:hypothetical protein